MASGTGYERYLLEGEEVVVAIHQHWAKMAAPVLAAVVGLVVAIVVDATVPETLGLVPQVLWWGWLALLAWTLWQLLEWRHDWFVATDKRLILTYGLVSRRVAMMPLTKVTDMSYERSIPGRLVGYGEFIMESAGQDQALRDVKWIPEPDATYRAICAEIFGVVPGQTVGRRTPAPVAEPDAALEEVDLEWGEPWVPDHTGAYAVPSAVREYGRHAAPDVHPDQHSRAIPVQPALTPDGESLYRSDDLRGGREAPTGPIPVYPPDED